MEQKYCFPGVIKIFVSSIPDFLIFIILLTFLYSEAIFVI